jgi:hypothetical protein
MGVLRQAAILLRVYLYCRLAPIRPQSAARAPHRCAHESNGRNTRCEYHDCRNSQFEESIGRAGLPFSGYRVRVKYRPFGVRPSGERRCQRAETRILAV